MATNPMMQAVLLFQNHQNTTPFLPGGVAARAAEGTLGQSAPAPVLAAKPAEEKNPIDNPPFDPTEGEEADEGDEGDEENEETEEEQDG